MRLFLPALLFLSAGAATAQPTLTAATNLPTPGLTNTLHRTSTATPGPGGANVTWDFSSLTATATVPSSYAACPGAAFCDSFLTVNPNLTGLEVLTSNTLFYNASTSSLAIVGARGAGLVPGTPVNARFTDPEDFLRFPMSYNTSYTDASRANYVIFGFPATRTGSSVVTADGWGTLKLPGGITYNNVLRVKRVATFYDTVSSSPIPQYASANVTLYLWYSTAYPEFLMLIGQTTSSFGNGTTAAWTLPGTAGVDDVDGTFRFSASPNPAADRLSIRWPAATEATLALQDLTGRTVARAAGSTLR